MTEIKIAIKKDVEIVLSIEEAKQLHSELDKMFGGKPFLRYPPGVRAIEPFDRFSDPPIVTCRNVNDTT